MFTSKREWHHELGATEGALNTLRAVSGCALPPEFAVRRVNEFAPPHRPQTIDPHQGAYPVSTYGQTALGHSCLQPAAAVGFVAGSKGCLEVDAGCTHQSFNNALLVRCPVCVLARAADFQDLAGLADCYFGRSRLLQVVNKLVAHRSSRAKKADAFFNMSTWGCKKFCVNGLLAGNCRLAWSNDDRRNETVTNRAVRRATSRL